MNYTLTQKLGFFGITVLSLSVFSPSYAHGVNDWTGLYAGISTSRLATGIINEDGSPQILENTHAATGGGFLGYNVTHGNLIIGPELALTHENYAMVYGGANYFFDGFADAKVKIGMTHDQWMAYVTAGATTGLFDYASSLGGGFGRVYGISLGLGASVGIGDHYYLGGELLHRNFGGIVADGNKTVLDGSVNTFSVRFGYRF